MSLVECRYEEWMGLGHAALVGVAGAGDVLSRVGRCDVYGGVVIYWFRGGGVWDVYVVGRLSVSSYKDIVRFARVMLGIRCLMVYHDERESVARIIIRLGFCRVAPHRYIWRCGSE
jgi:hypothetical protein